MNRRNFINRGMMLGSVASFAGFGVYAQQDKPAALDSKLVNEFIRVAHGNMERLKEMLEEQPLLLNVSWDWGKGDFETALGAAGHMGLKDYAIYLLDKGARPDIFVLTMLGETAIVKALCESYPALVQSAGPHGLTLLHHAMKGGSEGEELHEYFLEKGLTDYQRKIYK